MINISIKIKANDPVKLKKALVPDIEETNRFKVSITTDKENLLFNLKAKDVTAARAAVNSYLRLVNLATELEVEPWN